MGSSALLDDIREALAELSTADAPVLTRDGALRLITDK
jgi:hypothetical protein